MALSGKTKIESLRTATKNSYCLTTTNVVVRQCKVLNYNIYSVIYFYCKLIYTDSSIQANSMMMHYLKYTSTS